MSTPTRPQPEPGVYDIDPATSTVRFKTRHLFGLGAVHGTFTLNEGTVTVPDDPNRDLHVHLGVDASSFATGNARRDEHVRGPDFLNSAEYPTIEFTAATPLNEFTGSSLTGTLHVAGQSSPLTITTHPTTTNTDTVSVQGTTTVNRNDFGITKMRGMAARDLELTIAIAAALRESGSAT